MARFIDGNLAEARFLALKGAALDLGGLRLANVTLSKRLTLYTAAI
jgi:hypothetical protein